MSKALLTRRQLLKTTAGAAGASLAARTVLLDSEPALASPRAVPASDRVRLGIVGIGMQGSGLLSTAIQLPGAERVAAADLYDGRHTLPKEITGNPSLATTRRYQELLDRKDIDCLIAAVPDHWHKRVVVDACSAGKDIYCEVREEYFKQWHQENDPKPGQEPLTDDTIYRGNDWDDVKPHLWNFFQAVRTRKPVVEDAVFGNHAALACHMANVSYFRNKPVCRDAASQSITS